LRSKETVGIEPAASARASPGTHLHCIRSAACPAESSAWGLSRTLCGAGGASGLPGQV